jgi:hypothetical protein
MGESETRANLISLFFLNNSTTNKNNLQIIDSGNDDTSFSLVFTDKETEEDELGRNL